MARKRTPTPPTLVVLVRHGRTPTTGSILPGRAAGLHLSEAGQADARAAAQRVAGLKKVAAVYASPLERTRETAAPIAKAVGCRVRSDRNLLECDFGDWTGQELKVLRKLPEWEQVIYRPSSFRFPGGESFAEMQHRITAGIAALVDRHPGETIVAVSHADPIKAAIGFALGQHLDLFQRIVVSPCSLTPVLHSPAGPVVLAVNSTGDDLSALAPS